MSMFKNTSKRRVLSWILTLTMLFSQFFGTGSTLVAHAADPEAHNVTTHSGMSYTGDGAVITFKCEGAGKSTPEIEEDDFACVANGETLTIVKPTRTQYKGTGDVTATLTKSNTGSTVFTNTADAIVYYSATEEQFAAYLNDTSKPITSLGTTAPENVGSYVAAITVGGATAYVPYSIEKATPVYSVTNASKDYNAVAVEPIVKATFGNSDEIEISEGVEYLYKKSAEDDSKYSPTAPAQAGAYIVKATVTGTDNYNGETFTADFTIAKANLTDQMVEISNWVAGETPSTPTVSAKFDDESVNFTEAGGTVSYAYKLKSEADTAYKAAQPTAKGAYTVKATVTGMKNFNDVVATTDFDITALTQTAPSEPKMDSNTFDSITLIPIANGEYSIDGENWQDSVLFEGLTADTEYTFYQRYKADDTHDASEATSAKFKTKAHVHQWTFTAKDDVITATCQDGDAHHGDEKDATFTIVSPGASINYNGSEHPATIEFKNPSNALVPTDLSDKTTVEGITIPKIVYTKDDVVMEGVPTDAGIYTASITIGTVTASVEYEIKKATALDDVDAKYKPKAKSDLIYDGSAQALVDLTDIVALDGYTIMYAVGKTAPADEKGYSAVIPTRILATTDLEPYTVWYMFKGNGNHEDITNGAYHFNVKIGKKEITVTPNPITSTYGDEITDAGVKYEGFVEGQDEVF